MNEEEKGEHKWDKMNKSYENYKLYIKNKEIKFKLTLIDLLFISNFKGGNASIHEEVINVDQKLIEYTKILNEIENNFTEKKIHDLDDAELKLLINHANELIELTENEETSIDGFSVSYLTALLSAYFPDLYPIMDRRVLNGLGMLHFEDTNSLGQVKNLKSFYPRLIERIQSLSAKSTLRDLDKEYFKIKFDRNALPRENG